MLYVDTSVLVAYYSPEPLSQQAQRLLSEAGKPVLSYLTEVELYSAVAKKVRSKELSQVDGHRILAKFSAHVNADLYKVMAVAHHHWHLAKDWIGLFSTSLRTLDALHLSIASAEELELATSDKLLYQAAEMLSVKARLIGNP